MRWEAYRFWAAWYRDVKMNRLHNTKLTGDAKRLRRMMTKEERHLWYDFLKPSGINAHRQKVIGPYIVDFYIAKAKLAIELDGSQHYEEDGIRKDRERDAYLISQGLTVLRYSNTDINQNFEAVCEDILNRMEENRGL